MNSITCRNMTLGSICDMKDDEDSGFGDTLNKFVEVKNRKKKRERKRQEDKSVSESVREKFNCDCSIHPLAKSSPLNQVPHSKPKQKSKKQKENQCRPHQCDTENRNREKLVQRGEEEKVKKKDIGKTASKVKQGSDSLSSTTALKPSEVPEASKVEQQVYSSREVPPWFSHKLQKMQAQQGQRKTSDSVSADNQDIGTWQNPEGAWGKTQVSSANDIIVDTHDKEAWPSIGDKSDIASTTGDLDSTSVKTISVISSSSNPGQTQVNSVLQSSSAIQGQSASSVWGSQNFNNNPSDEKIDSCSWDSTPGSACQFNSKGWGESLPVSSVNNQGLKHMQSGQSVISGSDNINSLNNRIPSGNWGLNNTAVGNNNGQQNTMQTQEHGNTSSGAQTVNNGPPLTDSQAGRNNAMSWQGINFSSPGLPGLQKDQAANNASAWGNVSVGNSVIGSGLAISTSTTGSYSTDSSKGMDQWGSSTQSSTSSSSFGWNTPSSASQPEPSGWGSPCPSPIPGAGTEAWGSADTKNPPQSWGQPNSKANRSTPTSWGQPDAKTAPQTPGWGDIPPESSSNSSSGWGQPPPKPSSSPWGQSPSNNNQSQWGAAAGTNQPPAQQSQWGAAGAGAASAGPSSNTAANQGAWGGSGPVGSKPPPPSAQQSQPTSWAQAAGRGLYAQQQQNKPPTPNAVNSVVQVQDPKEQYISHAVNSHDGWGKRPVRQDASWDVEESPKLRRRNSNTEIENPSSHWDNNKGTAIWEASKGSAAPPPPPQWDNGNSRGASGGSGSGSDWSRDNDSGHWNGPPGENMANQWNGPPNNNSSNNQWGGGNNNSNQWGSRDGSGDRTSGGDSHWGGGSSSSNSWDSNKSENTWGSGKEDNVWDRNGTNAWGSNSKVETGMWSGSNQRRSSSSSWVDDSIEASGWDESEAPAHGHQRQNSGGSVDDGTAFWGDPTTHKASNWNSQPGTPSGPGPRGPPQDDKSIGMWGGPTNSKPPNNWADRKPDDGNAYWNPNQPPQPPSQNKNWGDSQWTGVKPKTPSGSWSDSPDWNQQPGRRMGEAGGWGGGDDGASSVLDDTDMGNWEGSQDSTSSWTSAPRDWNKSQPLRRNKPPPFMPGNGRQQPQMRSKLLQQLTEMGFKREDAQNALISNNMNMESAIADLVQGAKTRHEFDLDGKRKITGIQPDGLSDTQTDISQLMPPVSNTPFSGNAQQQLEYSQVIANPPKGGIPSLQNPSSLSGLGQSSISPSLQQRILQHTMATQQQFGGLHQQQGQNIRGQMSAQSMQQQQQQLMRQTVEQLRMAVHAGLISPQLLYQQMTPSLRIMLHQILQFQETHKQLVAQQQLLQQHLIQQKQQNPVIAHQLERQLEEVTATVQHIKQQMARLQRQMAQAETTLPKQGPGSEAANKADLLKELTTNMSGLNLSNKEAYLQQQQQQQQQQQKPQQQQQSGQTQSGSRLNQWKLPSPEKECSNDLNKAPGSKPLTAAHSAPNLPNKLETSVPSSLPFSDSTWSTLTSASTSTGSWPSTSVISSTVASTTTTHDSSEPKESPSALDTPVVNTSSEEAIVSSAVSATVPSSSSPIEGGQSGININDMIEEFVPGKRWQGITTKSVEDDPYITPGSIQRPSLSVNTIKDDYVMTTLGKSTSPTVSESALGSTWGTSLGSLGKTSVVGTGSRASWSSSSSLTEQPSLGSELWGIPQGSKNTRPPPGLTNPKQPGSNWQSGGSFNRSVSWAPGDRSFSSMSNAWSGGQQGASNCLLLKNLTPQIDGSTLRTLCQQHGPLQAFYLNLGYGQAIVRYGAKDEAAKAQMSLNSCVLGNTTIIAEFVSDTDAARLLEQLNSQGSSSSNGNVQQQTSLMRATSEAEGKDSSQWNGASTVWSSGGIGSGGGVGGSSLWDGTPGLDEHNSLLSDDLLQSQTL